MCPFPAAPFVALVRGPWEGSSAGAVAGAWHQRHDGLWPRLTRNDLEGLTDDRSTGTCGNPQGWLHPQLGRRAPELGCHRTTLRWLGDLSRKGLAGRSEPAVRIADERLVGTGRPALG